MQVILSQSCDYFIGKKVQRFLKHLYKYRTQVTTLIKKVSVLGAHKPILKHGKYISRKHSSLKMSKAIFILGERLFASQRLPGSEVCDFAKEEKLAKCENWVRQIFCSRAPLYVRQHERGAQTLRPCPQCRVRIYKRNLEQANANHFSPWAHRSSRGAFVWRAWLEGALVVLERGWRTLEERRGEDEVNPPPPARVGYTRWRWIRCRLKTIGNVRYTPLYQF